MSNSNSFNKHCQAVVVFVLLPLFQATGGEIPSNNAYVSPLKAQPIFNRMQVEAENSVDWEAQAQRLQREVEVLRNENHKLNVEREIKSGSQRTLDQFLARHRTSPRPLDFLSSEYQDSTPGIAGPGQPLIACGSSGRKLGQCRKKRLRSSRRGANTFQSSSYDGWVDSDTVRNIFNRSEARGLLPFADEKATHSHDVLVSSQFETFPDSKVLWKDIPRTRIAQSSHKTYSVIVPDDHESLVDAVAMAEGRELHVCVREGMHSWDETLQLKCNSSFQGSGATQMVGAWELNAEVGGAFRDLKLINEFDSCIAAISGKWDFRNCFLLSSGQSSILDPIPHTRMSTALYCVSTVNVGLAECTVGGIDQDKTASWGIFCCSETSLNCQNCTILHCDESAVAGVDDSALVIQGCMIRYSCVGVSIDDDVKAQVRHSVFCFNDAALETGFAGCHSASLTLQDNEFRGCLWSNSDRPIHLDEERNLMLEGQRRPQRPAAPFSFLSQKAAGVSEEDSLEEEHGQELGGMDEPKNLRTVALRALARAEHENYIKPLPMYENE